MFIVISPAKKLDFESKTPIEDYSDIKYAEKALQLIKELRKCSQEEISKLMKLSDSLAKLNVDRYKSYDPKFNDKNSRQAVFAFSGDTYVGLDANSLKKQDLTYSQKHLGILSGLYGLLSPLDRIQPYRLEMGTRFSQNGHKNLYDYWKEDVTEAINEKLKKEKYLINCSSNEYFSVIDTKKLNGEIITPVFKEMKNGEYKVISFNAKRARGMMSRYIIQNRLTKPEELKSFDIDGYQYSEKLSQGNEIVFTRG
ncbi:MAG: peroxide stress protein YaaA [Oligoflexia bacterium]|nr:peroxide stress protein YaaA [Oligoflexia bacterium]